MLTLPIFNKWIEALQSSVYTQSFRGLHPSPDCFCALGVLADILTHEYPDTFSWESLLSNPIQCQTVILNDEQGKSFSEMASYLIENRKEIVSC